MTTQKRSRSESIDIWTNAYVLTLGNAKNYKKRLRELYTWNKPLNDMDNDPNGNWNEWSNKISALKDLIEEEYPNTVYTMDNKVILKK